MQCTLLHSAQAGSGILRFQLAHDSKSVPDPSRGFLCRESFVLRHKRVSATRISCLRGMLQKPARTPEVRLIARVTFRSRYIPYFDFESTWLENERSTSPSTFGSD